MNVGEVDVVLFFVVHISLLLTVTANM